MSKLQKKNSALMICLWIFLLPIMLTISIVKIKKINKNIKVILIIALWLFVIIFGKANQDNKQMELKMDTVTESKTKAMEKKNEIAKEDSKPKDTVKKQNEYHKDDMINKLLTEYNKVAEVKIPPNTVSGGAYSSSAITSCNGVYIMFYSNSGGVFIDYQLEAKNDSRLFTVFRDFAKAMNPNLADSELRADFDVLSKDNVHKHNDYEIKGISCDLSFNKLINGQTSYILKTYVPFKK